MEQEKFGIFLWERSLLLYNKRGYRCRIVLDEALVERARQLTGIKTKREVIHEALRTLIQLREQAQVRELRCKLRWEGDLNISRESRSQNVDI